MVNGELSLDHMVTPFKIRGIGFAKKRVVLLLENGQSKASWTP